MYLFFNVYNKIRDSADDAYGRHNSGEVILVTRILEERRSQFNLYLIIIIIYIFVLIHFYSILADTRCVVHTNNDGRRRVGLSFLYQHLVSPARTRYRISRSIPISTSLSASMGNYDDDDDDDDEPSTYTSYQYSNILR